MDFDAATKSDIEDLVFEIKRSNYSPWTKRDYNIVKALTPSSPLTPYSPQELM